MPRGRATWTALLTLLVVFVALPSPGAGADGEGHGLPATARAKMEPAVLEHAEQGVEVALPVVALSRDPEALVTELAAKGIEAKRSDDSSFVAFDAEPDLIKTLARSKTVGYLAHNFEVRALLDGAGPAMRMPTVWDDFGVTGSGIGVAVLDTGIHAAHPDFSGRVIGWYDAVAGTSSPVDPHGHGTHVAAIVASSDATYRGVAPEANIIGVRVLDASGSGTVEQIVSGLQWTLNNRAALGIRVVTMSLGAPDCSNRGSDLMSQMVNTAAQAGLLVVVAAGNTGPKSCINTPGAARGAFTVGSVRDPSEGGIIASRFSSRGPTGDGRVKPDIMAPGEVITAAKTGGGHVSLSGTSMATPFVAGVAALMFAAKPTMSAAQVRQGLERTALDLGAPGKDNEYGFGLVNPHAALRAAMLRTDLVPPLLPHVTTMTGSVAHLATNTHNLVVPSTHGVVGVGLYWSLPNALAQSQGCATTARTPDLDLRVRRPDTNAVVASSLSWGCRQEQVSFVPPVTGTYKIEVASFSGSASYRMDASVPALDLQAPVVRMVSPVPAAIFENSVLPLTFTARDNVAISDVYGVVQYGGDEIPLNLEAAGSATWGFDWTPLGPGNNKVIIHAIDSSGNTATFERTFTVTPGFAPEITAVEAEWLTPTQIAVRWETDIPATSQVYFGTGWPTTRSALSTALVTEHEVIVNRLRPGTTYNLQPESRAGLPWARGPVVSVETPSDILTLDYDLTLEGRVATITGTVIHPTLGPAEGLTLQVLIGRTTAGVVTTDETGAFETEVLLNPGTQSVTMRRVAADGWRVLPLTKSVVVPPLPTELTALAETDGIWPRIRVILSTLDGGPVPGGRLTGNLGGTTIRPPATNALGESAVTLRVPADDYETSLTFPGGRGFLSSTYSDTLSWIPIATDLIIETTIVGSRVQVTAQLTMEGTPVPGATIRIEEDGTLRGTLRTNTAGIATGRITTTAGEHDYVAIFTGLGLAAPVEVPFSVVV